jgi:hypothetical protein
MYERVCVRMCVVVEGDCTGGSGFPGDAAVW